jgi:hypothetical protein
MTHIWNKETAKWDVYITQPSYGIKEPKTNLVGSFDLEIEAIAGSQVARQMLKLNIPTNQQINNWIGYQLK